jgi:hypothetical protein
MTHKQGTTWALRTAVWRHTSHRKILAVVSLAVFLASLASPVFLIDSYPDDRYRFGIGILACGWVGPLHGEFRWYANLIFLYVMYKLFSGAPIFCRWLLFLALFLSAATMLFPYHRNTYGQFGHTYAHFGIRSFSNIVSFELGVYLWAASMLLAAAGVLAANNSLKPTRTGEAPVLADQPER